VDSGQLKQGEGAAGEIILMAIFHFSTFFGWWMGLGFSDL
jgi:hypothetical protein